MLGIHYITFGVTSQEYALDIPSSTIWEIFQNMLGIHYITFSVKSLEYALDIQSSNAYSRDFTYSRNSKLWNIKY